MAPIIGIIWPWSKDSRKAPDEIDHTGYRTAGPVLQPSMMSCYMSAACFLEGAATRW
jgi:hypothetical protein